MHYSNFYYTCKLPFILIKLDTVRQGNNFQIQGLEIINIVSIFFIYLHPQLFNLLSFLHPSLAGLWIGGILGGEGLGIGLSGSRGDKLTCSKARNWISVGYSLTQTIRGPVPVAHLKDSFFPNWHDLVILL